MPQEPSIKSAIAFIDGQNLFHAVNECFGYRYPNFDLKKLVETVANENGFKVKEIRFYTGIPDARKDEFWHKFWSSKMVGMGRDKILLFTRPLKYRTEYISHDDGTSCSFDYKQEKGIDVRIALDVISLAIDASYDVALIFSQDQDLAELSPDIKKLSLSQNRWIQVCSVFPTAPNAPNKRGINQTSWLTFDQRLYDSCIDYKDYRPKSK